MNLNKLKLKWIEMNWYGTSHRPAISKPLNCIDLPQTPSFFAREITFTAYEYVHAHYSVCELPWNSAGTHFIALLLVDMAYYWLHRAAHEINFFWAAHHTQHSSQEYNLTTALRRPVFQPFVSWVGTQTRDYTGCLR